MRNLSQATTPTAPTVPLRPAPSSRSGAAHAPIIAPSQAPPGQEGCPFLALVLPSDEGERSAQAMENCFQACATDEPFALEIVGTEREQRFVLRASSETQLNLLCKQLEAQYPQCEIRRIPPSADPLLLSGGEYALLGEFALREASWMPLKTFTGRALSEAGTDPLAGILAAMETVGPGERVISQLALVRARDTWLSADLRKAVEHPLQHERDALSLSTKSAPLRSDTEHGLRLLFLLLLLFAALFIYRWYQASAWLPMALLAAGALIAFLGLIWWKLTHTAHPIYDMKMVAEKLAKAGFYVQLRVIVVAHEPVVRPSASVQQRETALSDLEKRRLSSREEIAARLGQLAASRTHWQHHLRLPKDQQDANLLATYQHICHVLMRWIEEREAELARLEAEIAAERKAQTERQRAREQERRRLLAEQERHLHACLTGLEVAYRQFTLASANGLYLKHTKLLRAQDKEATRLSVARLSLPYASPLARLLHRGAYSPCVLNSLELAGMYHLPQETADLPLVERVSVKHLLASPEIAHQIAQQMAPLAPALIGISTHRRYRVPVLLPFDALFSHKAAFGMSRTGKTALMLLLVVAAMQPVRDRTLPQPGIFCIDPHRDFIMDILRFVAGKPELERRVVLLDLTDTAFPVALNPLDASMGFTRDQAVSNLMSSFREIWREYWGPRMAYFLNAVCLLLYTLNQKLVAEGKAEEQYTLLDVNPLLQYKDYALKVLAQLDMSETWHRELLAWWKNTYFTLPANSSFRQEVIMPILSKIGVFNDNQQLRHIVGQPVTKAPVHLAVREGKIVLCALSTKDMSEEAVNILGSTLVNLLHSAFSLQQPLALTRRRKVFCALDEFHAFSGSQLDRMLSEDAKLGCSMLLATQNLKRLNKIRDGLMEMVFSNCQQLFAFRMSAADARILEEELQKRVSQKHIISQPALHCYARLSLVGYPLQVISVDLAKPTIWQDDPQRARQVEEVLRASQGQYLPVAEVERRYEEHLQQFLDVTAYARRVNRDTRAADAARHDRAEAEQRAKEQEEDRAVARGVGVAGDRQDGAPSGQVHSPEVLASTAPKSPRNHRHHRSRRQGKHPIGTPPPEAPAVETSEACEVIDALRPLPSPGRVSWKTSFRERERPE
jgi:hypothetical protein